MKRGRGRKDYSAQPFPVLICTGAHFPIHWRALAVVTGVRTPPPTHQSRSKAWTLYPCQQATLGPWPTLAQWDPPARDQSDPPIPNMTYQDQTDLQGLNLSNRTQWNPQEHNLTLTYFMDPGLNHRSLRFYVGHFLKKTIIQSNHIKAFSMQLTSSVCCSALFLLI